MGDEVMLSVRVPRDLRRRLKMAAIREQRTMEEIVQEAITRRLDEAEEKLT